MEEQNVFMSVAHDRPQQWPGDHPPPSAAYPKRLTNSLALIPWAT